MVSESEVLKLVKSRSYRQMRTEELAQRLSVGAAEMDEFVALLEDLERQGQLVKVKKEHWVSPESAGLVTGRLQCSRRGFGFVVPVAEDQADIYVAEEDMGEAMHDDLVVVEIRQGKGGRGGRRRGKDSGPAGRVIKVVEHRNLYVIGAFVPAGKFGRVVPDNPRLFRDIYVAREDWKGAEADDQVLVELTVWPSLHQNPEGEVREVLGKVGAPGTDVKSVIFEFGLPRDFPDEVLLAARRIPDSPPAQEKALRQDFRQYTTVTVDPEDAKDFDDALSFYRDPATGRRVVMAHIADISFHAPPDSVLDQEARRRGNSVYLANEVVPMFPEEISREILSVVEGKDRLAKSVVMEFDEAGKMVDYSLRHSVVNVDRRMTYTEVQEVLDALDSEEPARAVAAERLPEPIVALLSGLDALAAQLRRRRQEVGSVDLDMPDYQISMDELGRVVSVSQIVRDRSHGLVEEFMLSANRAVADFMLKNKLPALFRIHEPPQEEDAEEFKDFIFNILGKRMDPLDRKALQALLAEVAGTHLAEAVNMQLLRSMQRALYSPQCKGHFALHFDRYCHFTSPVRRYPDLVVHQVLDQFIRGGQRAGELRALWKDRLPPIAIHCNAMQERADEAEREIVKVKLLRYLEDHRDQVFDAVVTGVREFGLFARLEDYSVEGLVKVQDIGGDFFRVDEKKKALVGTRGKKAFHLGQPIKVTIREIAIGRRELDLLLHE